MRRVIFKTSDEAKNYIREALGDEANNFDVDAIFEDTFDWFDGWSEKDECYYVDEAGFETWLDPDDFWKIVERHATN